MDYSIILENNELGKLISGEKFKIRILSNIITDQLNEILEYNLRINNIPAEVKSGDYDNIVKNSLELYDQDLIIIFWEISNLVNGFHYNIELFDDRQYQEITKRWSLK